MALSDKPESACEGCRSEAFLPLPVVYGLKGKHVRLSTMMRLLVRRFRLT